MGQLKVNTGAWSGVMGGFTQADADARYATIAAVNTKWTMWTGTQAAYDAIGTKDPGTLYVIV